nr:selenide, water dikinase SelD [Synergistaceae bacterium]
DFITPIVDDAYTWGQIAAANSISDVFAMGGRPLIALNVVNFPTKLLSLDILKLILDGGYDKTREAGAFLVGGHSVQDDEPKYGLVVYGEVDNNKIWRTTGAKDGDKLILTKPLGTGIAATAIKANMLEDKLTELEAIKYMRMLNSLPLYMDDDLHDAVHAATDVTGFGLAGHVLDMLSDETIDLNLNLNNLPSIAGVKELADMGLVPEGAYRNRAEYEHKVDFINQAYSQSEIDLMFDAQTSGGLLLAARADKAEQIVNLAKLKGFDKACIIGEFVDGTGRIRVI